MSTKSNLQLARKYEWNSMMAKASNHNEEADRYAYMSKMATLDAGLDFSDNINSNSNTPTQNNASNHATITLSDIKKHPVSFILGIGIGSIILFLTFILSMLM